MTPHLFCFGVGYTAQEVIRQLPGWRISGTRRSSEAASGDAASALQYLHFDGMGLVEGFSQIAPSITHVLISIPPGDQGDRVCQTMGEQLSALPNLKWVGYLSTTGVYGDLNGATATEDMPYGPSGLRGEKRMKAELEWQQLFDSKNLPLHIFRLPGIYGPGRNQMVALQKGKSHRIVKKGHVFSRIHVEDLGQILVASMMSPNPGRIYNVSDDMAAPPQDVVTYAAEVLGIDAPPLQNFETADLSPMARSFYSDNKRVSNDRIKVELGVSLRYPTYIEGLDAIYREL